MSTTPTGYTDFLLEVKTQIRQRQLQALRAVNSELLALYWWLGDNISQRQAALGWGKAVVETLAKDLQAEFPGRNGFSARNLWNMLEFYRDYATKPKLQPLVAEISWSKNLLIMARCKDDLEREFYLRATARFGWTKNVLQHQLDNHSYRQYAFWNQSPAIAQQAASQLMGIPWWHHVVIVSKCKQHDEALYDVQATVAHGRPKRCAASCPASRRLSVRGDSEAHRRIVRTASAQSAQLLQTGSSYYQQHQMTAGDHPPIGILLCTQKNHEMVQLALAGMANNLFASRYQLALPATDAKADFLRRAMAELGGGDSGEAGRAEYEF
jgi:predicted nuclease of restriction endonuclease-like (RecB) superfamily